jgi:transcriptional regulator with XRE-family HTH domain
MTGDQLRAARQSMGLTQHALASALGYTGSEETLQVQIARFENDPARDVPPWIARLVIMYQRQGIPHPDDDFWRL